MEVTFLFHIHAECSLLTCGYDNSIKLLPSLAFYLNTFMKAALLNRHFSSSGPFPPPFTLKLYTLGLDSIFVQKRQSGRAPLMVELHLREDPGPAAAGSTLLWLWLKNPRQECVVVYLGIT